MGTSADLRSQCLPWRTASVAVMRMAGFPFCWLDQLSAPGTVAAATRLRRANAHVDSLAGLAQSSDLRRQAETSTDRHLLSAMHRGRAPRAGEDGLSPQFGGLLHRFTLALAERDAAEQEYERCYSSDRNRSSAWLITTFRGRPALRDMLLVSNEDAYPRLVGWLDTVPADPATWRKKDRNNVGTLVRYLQRVCAKNDTTSHFGPLATARLASDDAGVHWTPAPLARRTMLSRWAAEAVGRRLAENPATWPVLRPRRAPGATLAGDLLRIVQLHQARSPRTIRDAMTITEPVRLEPGLVALYWLCDGELTVQDISLRAGSDLAATMSGLRRLEETGAVHIGPELPYGEEDALSHLAGRLGAVPAAAQACAELAAAVSDLGAAPADDRTAALGRLGSLFTRLTGVEARRGHSGFYSDRSVFHEHCLGFAGNLVLGEPLVTRMRRELGLLYDMFLLRPRWRLDLERGFLHEWFTGRFGSQAQVPLVRYLEAFLAGLDELEPGYKLIDERIAGIADAMEQALLPPHGDPRHVYRVDRRAIEQLVQRSTLAEPAICNPDLMIAARSAPGLADGAFRLVIGDLHAMDDHLSHGSIAPFVHAAFPHYRHEMLDLYRSLLRPGEELADVTQCHLNKTFPRIEPGCLDIEAHDRSGRPAARRLRLADLTVRADRDRLTLRTPDGRSLRLMVPPLAWPMQDHNPFSVFAFPADTDGAAVHGPGRVHLPRIEVGDVVLQRELWRVPAGQLASATVAEEPAAFLRVRELAARSGLPRHVFYTGLGEPKPVYCDLDSPLLVRQLTRAAATAGTDETVTLSEMLPGPDDLWLRDEEGARTCEIRYAVFNGAASVPQTEE